MTMPPDSAHARTPWVDRLLAVLDHIHAHLDAPIDPRDLARLAHFSPHHFHRVFRGMVGESVMEYVRRLRLERAALRLKYGDDSVTQVALASGYDSHEAFTRAFRARFGEPPSRWREQGIAGAAALDIRTEPSRRLLTARVVGPYDDVAPTWGRLMSFAGMHGLLRGAPQTFGLVYDDPEITDPAQCRYEAAVEIGDLPLPTLPVGLAERTLAAGRWAVTLHVGSYETIQPAYVRLLGQALPRQREELADVPIVERYLTDPRSTPPEQLRTEICVQLA